MTESFEHELLQIHFDNLNIDDFLRHYWQRKPLLIRQGFPGFCDLLSPDELAGLACEPAVESRLIQRKGDGWHAENGPFDSYDHLGEKDWSLVVQAADNWAPNLQLLIDAFHFLPDWRRDDVMISFATEGGSVGPHIDNYDTFICQGSGTRHWRVGDKGAHKQFSAHEILLHVEAFDAIIDAELNAGDILYIPPGYPHEGIALSPSMSFSVGYRTQSAKDALSALADHLIDHDQANHLLTDPGRSAATHAGLVDKQDVTRIRQHLQTVLEDDATMQDFIGCWLSQPKHALDAPDAPMDYNEAEVLALLQEQPLYRMGGLRCHYFEDSIAQGVFYLNGEKCHLPPESTDAIRHLCDQTELNGELLAEGLKCSAFVNFLTTYVQQGCWYFEG